MGRAADQLAEKQDVFRVEVAVGQVADDLRRFIRIVKLFGRLSGLQFRFVFREG